MTLGMGSLAMACSRACCKPSSKLAPATVRSKNKLSALPSGWRCSCATTDASTPRLCNFFNSAGVAAPLLSRPTDAGMSLSSCCLSLALLLTCVMWAANRLGDAKAVSSALASAKPLACKLSNNTRANALPNLFNTLGGSSSTNNSTSKLSVDMSGLLNIVGA